ncbi:MAG TPA: methyltransferase domain-containing protein [Pyrinomonadaceae bacterium]|nr:methyltransferase domain-containing protein [Pyrinomonadaceae bacterium]
MASKATETITHTSLDEEKQRAREQWEKDPCGAVAGRDEEFGTREFFDEVERQRYQEYAPWMPGVMGFNQFGGKRLLEVGCGMGTDLLQFARGGAICIGADLTPRSIDISRLHFSVYGMRAEFLLADGERLPFPDKSFDVVYSNGVLHHTPDTAGAIRELHRVLKVGGTAKVMLYNRQSLNFWGEMMLHRGVVRGELFRGRSPEDIMSRWVEYSEHEGRPLVKAYTRKQARELFRDFANVKLQVEQLTRVEFPVVGRFMPQTIFGFLSRTIGWNLIITATR